MKLKKWLTELVFRRRRSISFTTGTVTVLFLFSSDREFLHRIQALFEFDQSERQMKIFVIERKECRKSIYAPFFQIKFNFFNFRFNLLDKDAKGHLSRDDLLAIPELAMNPLGKNHSFSTFFFLNSSR